MEYKQYQESRDLTWKTILDCGVSSLPVNLGNVCNHYRIQVIPYSKYDQWELVEPDAKSGDGFSINIGGKYYIVYNDSVQNKSRVRFTIAHEIGHILHGHVEKITFYRNSEIDYPQNPKEQQANVFARDLLMPATVLAALAIHTAEEIMGLCQISHQSAEIRAERMKELYERNMFNKHPLERAVREQFDSYIHSYKK